MSVLYILGHYIGADIFVDSKSYNYNILFKIDAITFCPCYIINIVIGF